MHVHVSVEWHYRAKSFGSATKSWIRAVVKTVRHFPTTDDFLVNIYSSFVLIFYFLYFSIFFGRYLYPIGSIKFYFRSRKSQNWVVDRTYRPFCIWKQVFFWVNNKYFLSQINNWRTIRSYVYEFIQNTCCKIGF